MLTLSLVSFLLATPPVSEQLQGSCYDAWTAQPLAGVLLRDLDGLELGRCDARGRFSIDVPAHLPRLIAEPPGQDYQPTEIHLPRDAEKKLLPIHLRIPLFPVQLRGAPADTAFGLPRPRPRPGPSTAQPLHVSTWGTTLPAQMPSTIRVLRCPSTTCCTAPGDGVETLAFEDYVKGVVNAEVGVFRNVSSVDGQALSSAEQQTGSAEVYKTLAVSSRSYALWWYLRRQTNNPGYDIRDGTCEQVYDSARHPWVDAAVEATRGQILSSSDGNSIDKYEYASSCKRLGSIDFATSSHAPACQDVIPDLTGIVACAGSWCGHDTANMGHQTHPCDPGRCRCLVRGICQWGAAERSYAGDPYTDILAHYQPTLTLQELGQGGPASGRLVGFVREGSISNTEGAIAGAQVRLDSGESTTTNASGYYELPGLTPGQTVQVTARAAGYAPVSDSKYLDPADNTWWRSLAMQIVDRDAGSTAAPDSSAVDGGTPDRGAERDRPATRQDGSNQPDTSSGADRVAEDRNEPPVQRQGCGCQQSLRGKTSWPALLLFCLLWARRRSAHKHVFYY